MEFVDHRSNSVVLVRCRYYSSVSSSRDSHCCVASGAAPQRVTPVSPRLFISGRAVEGKERGRNVGLIPAPADKKGAQVTGQLPTDTLGNVPRNPDLR